MKKKILGSVVLASALCMGLGAVQSEAASWNNNSISSSQYASGSWSKLSQNSNGSVANTQVKDGQSSFMTGNQVQSGKSTGSAQASQSLDTNVDMGDTSAKGEVATIGGGTTAQAASVSKPSYVVQASRTTNAVFHINSSIEGGPTIQGQAVNSHSYQASTVIQK